MSIRTKGLKKSLKNVYYAYISNNNTSKLPEKARWAIETWNTAPETYAIRIQIGLVKDYIQFGDLLTEEGNAK